MKNTKLLRIISLLLALAMMAISLVACKPATDDPAQSEESSGIGSEPSETPSDSEPEESLPEAPGIPEATADAKIAEGGKTSFKIIRPEITASYEKNLTSDLATYLTAESGVSIPVGDDWVNEALGYTEGELEILIGRTNRKESEIVYSNLRADDYAVTVVGKKLVIAAFTELKMNEAISYFKEKLQAGGGNATFLAADSKVSRAIYGISAITVNGTELSNYKIVYKTGTVAEMKNAANLLAEKLLETYRYSLKVVTDSADETAFEIVIGGTNRGESQAKADALNSFDYSITVEGSKIYVIPGANDKTPETVVNALVAKLEELKDGGKIALDASNFNVSFASEYATKNITLNGSPISDYIIIYRNNDPVTSKLAYFLRDEIDRVSGRRLTVASDSQGYRNTKEILVGLSKRTDKGGMAEELVRPLGDSELGEYLMYSKGDFFFVGGNDNVANVGAVNKLIAAINNVTNKENHTVDFDVKSLADMEYGKYSVITYNDGDNATTKLNQVSQIIIDYAPDIVGMQEVQKMHVPMYESKLGHYTGVYYDHDTSLYGAPIFFNNKKFELVESGTQWLSSTPDKKFSSFAVSDYIRSYVYAILKDKATGEEIVVVNTHVDYIAEANALQIEVLLECTERFRGRPIIYTGDFNMQNTSDGYKQMYASGLRDCGSYLGHSIKGHIDFCFVDLLYVVPTSYKYITDHEYCETASDHMPVYQEIAIPRG